MHFIPLGPSVGCLASGLAVCSTCASTCGFGILLQGEASPISVATKISPMNALLPLPQSNMAMFKSTTARMAVLSAFQSGSTCGWTTPLPGLVIASNFFTYHIIATSSTLMCPPRPCSWNGIFIVMENTHPSPWQVAVCLLQHPLVHWCHFGAQWLNSQLGPLSSTLTISHPWLCHQTTTL